MTKTNVRTERKITKLHRNNYYWICAEELAKRDGIRLDELPDSCSFWADCYNMTEELYGPEGYDSDGRYIWPCCSKASQIAADPALTHADKVKLIQALWDEWEKRDQERRKKREAAKTPEQRAREQENMQEMRRWLASVTGVGLAMMEESGCTVDSNTNVEPIEVIERPFDEHLTEGGRISAKGLGIRLD